MISDKRSIFSPDAVNIKLAKIIESFQVPKWVLNNNTRKCPECGALLLSTSVREVGLCLNAQNIGDIQVEILCKECFSGFYLFFRNACKDFKDFSQFLCQSEIPSSIGEPIQGNKLTARDNNLTDAIVKDINKQPSTKKREEKCQ